MARTPHAPRMAIAALLLLAAVSGRGLAAQEASSLLSLCDKPSLSLSEAAWLALSGANLLPPGSGPSAALARLRELGWIRRASREDVDYFPATVGEFAFLSMMAYRLRGGVGYAFFPGPRYAYRELSYRGLLPANLEAGQAIGGILALRSIARIDEYRGSRK